jgi:hypothetical protein
MAKKAKRIRKTLWRHIDANVLGVAAAALLLSYSFSFAPPTVVVKSAASMLGSASVGMTAAVDENPFNTLAQQLVNKERELQARESSLDQREYVLDAREAPLALYSLILGLSVCLLVLFNFYFDWRRAHRTKSSPFVVDVRRT